MILIIDNYDSFTYNLVQYLGELGAKLCVRRNDKIGIERIKRMKPERIVISPGPGGPPQAGISNELVKTFAGKVPILGVCLGHQCIADSFGAEIIRADRLMHGKTSLIYHNGETIYKDLENPFVATRYHSLIVKRESLPGCFQIVAETKEKEIMGIVHDRFPLWGVQFHPESILTKVGKQLLANFLKM
ncbi:aminodeoxychorismate/anthranilate synthase component II [bacterium]|nr:aminodeoxychorismate/anthranilate synthase component II [bacterium]